MGKNKTFPIISFNNNLFLSEIVMYYLTQFDTEAEYTAYKNSNVNAYKAATNWSTYADKIKGISEMQ